MNYKVAITDYYYPDFTKRKKYFKILVSKELIVTENTELKKM